MMQGPHEGEPESEPESEREGGPPALPALRPAPRSVAPKDLLAFYLAEVRRYPLLSPEEERTYAVRYRETQDREAAQRLVTSNLRLVIRIAFQYHRRWANVLDLIQEGNVGLVEALSRYDPTREIRFSSYAQYWIRAMILRFLLDNFRLVRLGSTRSGRKLFFQLQKERERLLAEGEAATPRALASRLGVTEEEIADVDQHLRAPAMSLHGPASDDPGSRTLSDIVPETVPHNPESAVVRGELSDLMQRKLTEFAAQHLRDDRERLIWERRLLAQDPLSLTELGTDFDVSKERIRQVEARLKKRLKAFLEAELGDAIDFDFADEPS